MRLTALGICLAVVQAVGTVQVLSSNDRRVTLLFRADDLTARDVFGGAVFDFVDAEHTGEPGEWDLPTQSVRIGIPQQGGVRVSVSPYAVEEMDGVCPPIVPSFSWDGESAWTRYPEPVGGFVPDEPVTLSPIGVMRDVRFVTVRFQPVQFDPDRKRLRVCREMQVTVSFERSPEVSDQKDLLDGWVAAALANGALARYWKLSPTDRGGNQSVRAGQWLKIKITETGLYVLTGADLAAAGVALGGLEPRSLAMYTLGEHVPNRSYPDSMTAVSIVVTDDGDGHFGIEDTILFYGLAPEHWIGACSVFTDNVYTDYGVYWLSWDCGNGLRVSVGLQPDTAGTPVLRSGRDVLRQGPDLDCPARSGLLWIWKSLYKPTERHSARLDVELALEYPQQIERIAGRLLATRPDNALTVNFNERPLAGFRFNQALPNSPFFFSIDTVLPCGYASNRVQLDLSGDGEKQLYLDYLEVWYSRRLSLAGGQLHFVASDTGRYRFVVRDVPSAPLVFDVTDPYHPVMTTGFADQGDSITFCQRVRVPRRFVVAARTQLLRPVSVELRRPGRLANRSLQSEHWLVTPREFLPAAQEYARFRSGRVAGIPGARCRVAVLDEIYDDYCFGYEEPWAVKRFFADKRPAYGLLIGDATYDYRNRLGGSRAPGVPAYETGYGLDPDGTQDRSALAVDAAYADFEGEGASPDMALGRVTVRSGAELRQFLDKVRLYEDGPSGIWTRRYLLLADDEFMGDPTNPRKWDPIGFGHIEYCEAVSVMPGSLLDPVRVYLTEYPYAQVKNKPGANAELLRQINLGSLLWVFFGHGAAHDLTHEGVLNIATVPQIRNDGRIPFCFFGSCSVGRFDDTKFESISEELVRMKGGAIATLGATKSTAAGSNLVFARNLLTPLFACPESTIGYAFLMASPTDRTYHLFGDPATVLRLPRPSRQQLRVAPDTLRPGMIFQATGLLELAEGECMWSLTGPVRNRTYTSVRGSVTYRMQGLEAARGSGRITDGRFHCGGVFPVGLALESSYVSNGVYVPIPRSCRLSASVWNSETDLSVLADTLAYTTQGPPSGDTSGPAVAFFCGGRRLHDGTAVPASFNVECLLVDPSGILIAPVPGATPEFFVGQRNGRVDLTDLLVFDESLHSAARFRLPVQVSAPVDSLCVLAWDNLLNRTRDAVWVTVLDDALLRADSLLIFPNPVRRNATICFTLTRSARVRVRIYSLSGKLVRELGETICASGYNQLSWDGTDRDGVSLSNGVYLLSLRAACWEAAGRSQSIQLRERFLIVH